MIHLVFPGSRVLLDDVHVARYFREKGFPGMLNINHDQSAQLLTINVISILVGSEPSKPI